MNTIEIARENFINASRHCYFSPTCPTFTKPNAKRGYGAVLKLLSNGSMPSRAAILAKLGLPTSNGYYASVFQALLWSKLISYDHSFGYSLTQLGQAYITETGLAANACSEASDDDDDDDVNDGSDDAHANVQSSWMNTYKSAMEAYKSAMEAYRVAMEVYM